MKKLLLLLSIIFTAFANDEDHLDHIGKTNMIIDYSTLDFKNSKKKDNGRRVSIEIDHQTKKEHYQLYYEKTHTITKPILPKNLDVNKYTIKYLYKIAPLEEVSILYTKINDSLMKETDDGSIYGIGYKRDNFSFTQYFSDYIHFDTFESDLTYKNKITIYNKPILTKIIAKYIHLKDKNSNNFSKNAKNNYFTLGLKAHLHHNGYHFGIGTYLGKRIFAIMKDGLLVQHHAMEFKESYMIGIGHKFQTTMLHLRYKYNKADEIPMHNNNVTIKTISLELKYKF